MEMPDILSVIRALDWRARIAAVISKKCKCVQVLSFNLPAGTQ